MFIRRKIKTLKGQSYEQHQLLKSVRTARGPRQEVVLNMGSLDLAKEHWKDLANTIEEKLNNQAPFCFKESCPEIEKLATHFAQMIVSKSLNQAQAKTNNQDINLEAQPSQVAADYHKVDINSVKTSESKSIGAEYVIAEQMNRYGFDKILQELDWSAKQIDYAKHLIIGRAVHPCSERELARWVNNDSAIKELIGSTERVYDNALHRTAVMLWQHRVEIQKSLRTKAKELFSLDEKIILYDLTNTYFEGKKAGHSKAQFGRSKERRSDCKLVTLALVVDSLGFPKESHLLAGNVSEPGTLAAMLASIQALGQSTEKKTLVIDAGIATEENIALLRKEEISYVAISRKRSHDPLLWAQSDEKKIRLKDKKTELTLKRAIVEVGSDEPQVTCKEALLLCHSPQKEIKETQIIERRLKKFEEALSKLSAGLSKPRTSKKFGKIMERIGRLKEKFHVGDCFDIKVSTRDDLATEITYQRNLKSAVKSAQLGEYIIRTDRLDLSEEDISGIHRSLTTIENSFRAMKSDLGLRPNYHKCEEATIAHIFLSVLAYHMVCPVLKRLSESGLDTTWNSVRNLLSSHDRVVTVFNTHDQHCISIRNTTTANLSQKSIYNALGIKHDPLKNIFFKRKIASTQQM
jgi:hypothetical protein